MMPTKCLLIFPNQLLSLGILRFPACCAVVILLKHSTLFSTLNGLRCRLVFIDACFVCLWPPEPLAVRPLYSLQLGVESSPVVSNCLIDMYGKCGSVQDATLTFDEMVVKDVISWNSAIAACARNGCLKPDVCFFEQMPDPDTISYNELISGFAQIGRMEEAIKILSNMPNPNSSSWNSIITGYVNRNQAREALDIFCKMHSKNIGIDQFTYSNILSGVASLSALTSGMLIHCCTIKSGLDASSVVGSALVDMYSKCGEIKNAELIFQALKRRNLVTWNAMLSGFAHNGKLSRVIDLFEQLPMEEDIKPNEITFLNVLSA